MGTFGESGYMSRKSKFGNLQEHGGVIGVREDSFQRISRRLLYTL